MAKIQFFCRPQNPPNHKKCAHKKLVLIFFFVSDTTYIHNIITKLANKGSLSKEDCDDVSFVNENEIGLWYDQKYILGLLKKIPHG